MAMRMPISRVRSVTETSMMFMMPMPPTISEMLAIDASRDGEQARVLVGQIGDLGQVAHEEVVVLSGADAVAVAQQGCDLRLRRVAGVLRAAETMIQRSQSCPVIFFCSVVIGTIMMSSWSWPMAAEVPFGLSRPTTLNGRLLMRTVWPMGSVAPKRFLRTVSPITATLAAIVTSSCVNEVPSAIGQLRTSKYCGSVPLMLVAQLSLPKTTWAEAWLPGAAA